MLKVACLPSHPLEKLVPKKKWQGSEAVYEALLPRCTRSARLVATLIQKVTKPLLKFLIVPVHMHGLHISFNF